MTMNLSRLFTKINFYILFNLCNFLSIFEIGLKFQYSYFEINKCPKCYGMDLCNLLLDDNLIILDIFSLIFSFKNVVHCKYLDQRIVLKKLGSEQDLSQLDLLPNENIKSCDRQSIMTKIYNSLMLKVIDDGLENNFSLQMCPRVNKFEYVIEQIASQRNMFKNEAKYCSFLYNMYITLYINPEPILLQMLNYEEYPIAKHLGFCGRVYAQSYMGETINKFYSSDWKIRANITIQLLNAAFVFTFKHEMFRIYLTDISMDNIAVSKSGKVSYIDLEHIVLVDKQFENVSYSKWYNNHTSEIIKCDNKDCFAFSPTDICSHNLSDHNIYMTCEMLLNESHNYLHGIPKEINERFPNLVDLLHDCVNPFRANVTKSRFSVSLEIKHILEESIQILSST